MKAILEKIWPAGNLSFSVRDFKGRRFECPFHHHPEIELTHIVQSAGQRYVGDHIGRFAAGDLVLMGADLPHMYVSDTTTRGGAQSRVLQFLPDCLGHGFFDVAEMKAIRVLVQRSRVGLSIHGRTRAQVVDLLRQMSEAVRGVDRLLLLVRILDALAQSRELRALASPSYSPLLSLHQGERINRVCRLIATKFKEGISQDEAARAARMSNPAFCRFFRRATNKTFRAFVNEVRIGHASQMLLETDCTISEACYESGFANLSNFNRQFLRLRRLSPRDYRKKALPGGSRQ